MEVHDRCELEVLWRYVTGVRWRSVEVRDMREVDVYGGT